MVFGSWERKLRKGGGLSAPATVLEIHKGRSLTWTNSGINGQPGAKIQEGTVATDRYKLRVQPDGEAPFETETKLKDDQLFGLHAVGVGSTVIVVFDPEDHTRVLIDVPATKAQARRGGRPTVLSGDNIAAFFATDAAGRAAVIAGAQAGAPSSGVADELTKLADLHDRGVLTDAEFETQKKQLLGE
jgi:hypothetical protein